MWDHLTSSTINSVRWVLVSMFLMTKSACQPRPFKLSINVGFSSDNISLNVYKKISSFSQSISYHCRLDEFFHRPRPHPGSFSSYRPITAQLWDGNLRHRQGRVRRYSQHAFAVLFSLGFDWTTRNRGNSTCTLPVIGTNIWISCWSLGVKAFMSFVVWVCITLHNTTSDLRFNTNKTTNLTILLFYFY